MARPLFFSTLALPFFVLVAGCGGSVVAGGSGGNASTGATTTGAGGAQATTSSTSSSTTSSATGGGACAPACGPGFTCCGGACVNEKNDILNCGSCGHACLGENPFCGSGNCQDAPCSGAKVCAGTEFCCGAECCAGGMLCCEVQGGGPSSGPKCVAPENGTCPQGCPACL